jgi:hypothetical protein
VIIKIEITKMERLFLRFKLKEWEKNSLETQKEGFFRYI